jgi:putative transposase
VSRFVYNTTVKLVQDPSIKANWKGIKTDILNKLPQWSKSVPYQIKSMAIKDACKSVSNAKKKFKNDGGVSKIEFRSRKDTVQSCYIPKSAVKDLGIYHTILGKVTFKEALPQSFDHCPLVFAHRDYYLTVPEDVPQHKSDNQGRVVAFDPGIRTFITLFSECSFGEIGISANLQIQKLCFPLDKLTSKLTKAKCKQRRRMKLAVSRLGGKIKNLVDELHKKTAGFLVDNFDIILLPTFETSQMSQKAKGRIRSKSVRQMLTISHYGFKQFLKHKAFETNKVVMDVNEAYTSKTVSWTGEIIPNLGDTKFLKSPSHRRVMSRDINNEWCARDFPMGYPPP